MTLQSLLPVQWDWWIAGTVALAVCTLAWQCPARADDPCEQPKAAVQRLLADLNRVAASYRENGMFAVKRLGQEGMPPARFEATYSVGGKTVLTGRFQQHDKVSEHLYVGVVRSAPGTLELAYGFGAGGKISCEYKIYKSGGWFVAVKTR